jgi:tetratricopeptide (TPR) repeat protein
LCLRRHEHQEAWTSRGHGINIGVRLLLPTMRILHSIFICWLILGLCSVRAQTNEAGETYLKGYSLKNEGEKLEAAGDLKGALSRYQQSLQIVTTVAQNYPSWQPEVVQYRLQVLQQVIDRLGQKLGVSTAPATTLSQPMTTANPLLPPVTGQPQPAVAPLSNDPFEAIRLQMTQKDATIRDLEGRLKTYADAYLGAAQARQKAEDDRGFLTKQLDQLKQQAAAIEKNSKVDQSELQRLRSEAKAVEDMISGKDKAVAEATKAVESITKEKEALITSNKKLEDENKELQSKVKGMPAGTKSDDFDKMMAENTRLKQELEVARKQVDELKSSGAKKDQEIASLKTQVTTIQGEMSKLQSENTEYQKQVADLTVKLKEMNVGLNAKPTSKKAAQLAEENKMLHGIILRQLRQQERQRQAKELVLAEMKSMKDASQTLMDHLEEMTSSKVPIMVDEESLFTKPELDVIYNSNANAMHATLIDTSKKSKDEPAKAETGNPTKPTAIPATIPSAAEAVLLAAAASAVDKGDFKAADQAYQDALRANPKNINARANLAGLKLQLKQYDQAAVELRRCLVLDPDDSLSLYRLGICYYQQGKSSEAEAQFERSLLKKPDNARAHHYLGIIASKNNKRDKAEAEFKSALAIDANYGDAHFNLAVLYATAEPPNWDLARKHYQDALAKGIKADPALEKLLKKTAEVSAPISGGGPSITKK